MVMMRALEEEATILSEKGFFDFGKIVLTDWVIEISDDKIKFSLSQTDKSFECGINSKFEHHHQYRNSIFYDNGTLIEQDSCYFKNFQPQFKIYRNHKLNKTIIQLYKDSCHCGMKFTESKGLFICETPSCPQIICSFCSQSKNNFERHCFSHLVEESKKIKDFIFKVTKRGENVEIDIPSETINVSVDQVANYSSQRLTFIHRPNNFYYDAAILNLYMKDGSVIPIVGSIFDQNGDSDKFLGHCFSKMNNKLYHKILVNWIKCWDHIMENKNQNYNFISYVTRVNDEPSNEIPLDVLSQLSSTEPIVVKSSNKILPHKIVERMPYFNELPILHYGGYSIFIQNKESFLDPNSNSRSIRAVKGGCLNICDLWAGYLSTGDYECLTNRNNQRELWINGKLLMRDMKLIGYTY